MKNIYFIIILSLLSISCTQQVIETDGSSSLDSRIATPDNLDDIPESTNYHVATCNIIKSSVNTFNAILLPHKNNSTNEYIPDQMYLNIKTIPSGVLSGIDYIRFFKEDEVSGVARTNPNPIKFRFMDSYGNELDTFTDITQLSKETMQTAIEESGLDVYYKNRFNIDYTPAHLMNQYEVLLTGLDLKYESIRTAFYSDGTTAPTSEIATLIPSFAAAPNTFSSLDNSTYMAKLHPMYERRNSGLTDLQFKQEIEKLCRN